MEETGRTASDVERDEKLLKMQERMKAPLDWPSIDSCKILDLQPQHFDDVLRLIKRHYFKDDPMCVSAGLADDPQSLKCYLEYIRVWMKDGTSLVAVSCKSERIVGVVIARPNREMDRSITYSRMQIYEGEALEKIMNFKNTLVKQADIHKHFGCPEIFRAYIICVHPSYRSKGLDSALLETFIQMAIALGMSAVTTLMTSGASQNLAKGLGFERLSEIRYSRWIVDDKAVFINPGIGNYSAAIMGMRTPSAEHLEHIWTERRYLKKEEERRRRKRKNR